MTASTIDDGDDGERGKGCGVDSAVRPDGAGRLRRGWVLALAAAAVLGLVALAADTTSASQLEGRADAVLAVRWTVSRVVSAGSVWAGLSVLAGWLVRRPGHAAAAGAAAALTALGVHYSAGQVLGRFDAGQWSANASWFAAALVLGTPLGLVGALARRSGWWGLPARLLVPVGAVAEPFYRGSFSVPALFGWPDRVSAAASGGLLLVAGLAGGTAAVVVRHRAGRSRATEPDVTGG